MHCLFVLIQILLQIEEFAAARHLFKKCKKYGSADPEKVNLAYKTGLYTCESGLKRNCKCRDQI